MQDTGVSYVLYKMSRVFIYPQGLDSFQGVGQLLACDHFGSSANQMRILASQEYPFHFQKPAEHCTVV